MRSESIRSEIQRLVRQEPFRPFVLNLENGDRIRIGHPENIAFEPVESSDGSMDFFVISGSLRMFSTFESVSSIATQDSAQQLV